MRKDKPSRTALKVAFNIVTLGSKPGMEAILPSISLPVRMVGSTPVDGPG